MKRTVTTGPGGVWDIGYHVAWCPKYRRPVLAGDVGERCAELIRAKASERGWKIVALEVMPDHVHLFVKTTPKDSPSFVANQFKGFTSRTLRTELPSLRCRLPTLWSRSYFVANDRVRMQGVGHVKVKFHRPARGTVKQFSVTRQGRRWFVNVICAEVPRQVRPLTGAAVGLDRGITHLVSDSDGGFMADPRHLQQSTAKLVAAQQELARKKRGSNRRHKTAQRVAALHRKVVNTRRDYLHKTSRRLVETYDLIALEALHIHNMTRSTRGTIEAPGRNVAAKAGLNRSINDAGWGVLQDMLSDKAEEAGIDVVLVNPANTSRTCHHCGNIAAENRKQEAFHCVACGHSAHADTNAARNILRLGLSLRQAPA